MQVETKISEVIGDMAIYFVQLEFEPVSLWLHSLYAHIFFPT